MSNLTTELDCAKAILNTYHQVFDGPQKQPISARKKLEEKNKTLEVELQSLKSKYLCLQKELNNRNEELLNLREQYRDKSKFAERLQEDFENAIHQLEKNK